MNNSAPYRLTKRDNYFLGAGVKNRCTTVNYIADKLIPQKTSWSLNRLCIKTISSSVPAVLNRATYLAKEYPTLYNSFPQVLSSMTLQANLMAAPLNVNNWWMIAFTHTHYSSSLFILELLQVRPIPKINFLSPSEQHKSTENEVSALLMFQLSLLVLGMQGWNCWRLSQLCVDIIRSCAATS